MSAYLDLLAVTHPRPTQKSQGHRRRRNDSLPLLRDILDAFTATGLERLSSAALIAWLDDHRQGWRPSPRDEAARASFLARELAMHGVRLRRGTYPPDCDARGIWRADVERAVQGMAR
jgi:hypothetical protein